MRIGIITLPLHVNYGGILQAYAMQQMLKSLGHDPVLIEKKRPQRAARARSAMLKPAYALLGAVTGRTVLTPYEQKRMCKERLSVHTEQFIRSNIRRLMVDNFRQTADEGYDAIIVGSDQIWRPSQFPDIRQAYLAFAEGWPIRRVAYAASFGTDAWEYTRRQTRECGRLLHTFDAISVREQGGISLCREHLQADARQVLDPTMMLTPQDYEKLYAGNATKPSGGTMLCYILDDSPQKTALTARLAAEKGLVPFSVKAVTDAGAMTPVEQWLRGFDDAQYVVTDSFHACVFSILYNKPFLAIGNAMRGMARFTSLLGMFGLEDRLVQEGDAAIPDDEIDWASVNARLDDWRKASLSFLKNGLGAE